MKLKPNSKLWLKLSRLPSKTGVYLLKDKAGKVIYVGKARSLKQRVKSHLKASFASFIRDVDFILTSHELEALLLENTLIKKYKPKYNILLKDDKQFPYLKLTNEEWPRLIIARKRLDDGARYFGRFTGGSARELIKMIQRIFPVRWCKENPLKARQQACLYEHLGQCIAPCVPALRDKNRYLQICKGIASFLEGDFKKTIQHLEEDMLKASENQEYEWAAALRKKIGKLKILAEIPSKHPTKPANLLEELQNVLKLEKLPKRIEAFDISNTAGTENVGSLVVFENGLPLKSNYRKFKLRRAETPDDTASIYEIVQRRYTGTLKDKLSLPDIILIDGGAGQLKAASKAALNTGAQKIPVIALAKKFEELYLPNSSLPLKLPKDSKALHLLQRIRDEAHRFAISYHKLRRKKKLTG